MKPANSKARALHKKLTALVERGIEGERDAAKRKLARLVSRFDFAAPAPDAGPDLFAGSFKPSAYAREPVCRFEDQDIGWQVKSAIENATGIPCVMRGPDLLAQARPETAERLAVIARTLAQSFRELWEQFAKAGANPADRRNFWRGLYDGMLNEERNGQPLPSRATVEPLRKARKKAVAFAPGLNLHPYTVAVGLGRKIRFCVPLADLSGNLETIIKGELAA